MRPRLHGPHTPRRPPPTAEDVYAGPIRGELLGAEQLAERARALAHEQRSAPERRRRRVRARPARLLVRLSHTRTLLDAIHARLATAAARGTDVGPAGDWLLDNIHVIREHTRQVHESLPSDYFRELPLLVEGPLTEYPRVYEIAITLISHTEGRIDIEDADRFVGAFQESHPLTIGELWAIPAMLRLGLIESVRRMALRTVRRLDEIEAADGWAERILEESAGDAAAMRTAFGGFVTARPPVTPAFVSRLLQQLRSATGAVPPLVRLEQWFAEEGLTPTDAATRAAQHLALTTLVMANSITSLRGIAQRDWQQFVETQSLMERILRGDPAGVYPRMTFATRDAYRHAVERIARGAALEEPDVARRVVALAQAHAGAPRQSHVGHWLVDDGVAELERETGYVATPGVRLQRWALRHPLVVYTAGVAGGTAIALALVFLLAGPDARTTWLLVLLATILPAFDIAVQGVSQLVSTTLPPRILPKLDFRESGVPEDCRAAIVIPTLLPSVETVEDALSNLEVQYLANRGANLHFALLSDFTDAPTETLETDDAIVEAAVAGIRALNARYAGDGAPAFHLFHRPRRWNPQQGIWMGWERKRGKLAEFNRALRGAPAGPFSVIEGDITVLRRVRYVITLDADTVLPPEAAVLLVGALAHPLNQAVYDPRRQRVVQGFGILQPRVGVSFGSAHRSRFASIFSGHPGVDPYTTAVSDVYQDLFGEGSFTGKGIYDLDAFETATHSRFPENTLLSHDLIEGNYARAGLVTDITVFDDYPARYLTYSRRKHRWIRGDWQLLGWLRATVPGLEGRERNRLSGLSRWKILDNLRRSTVEIAQFAFLIAGWTVLAGSPLRWTALALLNVAAPWIISLGLALFRPASDVSVGAYYAALFRDAITSAQQVALSLVFLPHQAWLSTDAIIRTLWRLAVTRRRMLEWQSAALTEASVSGALSRNWRAMWPAVAIPLGIGGAIIGLADDRGVALLAPLATLTALWIAAPFIAHALGKPVVRVVAPISAAAREVARRYARAHWEFFARYVTAETAWLAPDNVQHDPAEVVALRTSPTNIGLQLLSTISAHDLGFLPLEEMVGRLEQAFASIERLPRHRGHLYNWYALPDLRVLAPAYVSTVDSGNFAGHLIALAQACDELAWQVLPEQQALAPRLRALAEQADRWVQETDFGFLYDPSTKLFAIGFNTDTHRYDRSSYDLLASESRLASFVAIATGDVPVEHWFHLGRTLTWARGSAALVSWSGSMFEYLMPILVMRAIPGTLLGETYEAAVGRQMHFGAEQGAPWGVSESAYNVRDRHLTYQYRAFGVPDLALQRGAGRDHVVAPYASALAVMVDPEPAIANLRTLEALGALGTYGFYDALDYSRPPDGHPFTLVRCHMSHHVGMTLVALTNALLHRRWPERFHADSRVRAAALLLDERVPRHLEFEPPQHTYDDEAAPSTVLTRPVVREYATAQSQRPHVALLGHAPLTAMVTHAGSGYCRYENLAVTRWRPDGTSDDTGLYCYVADITRGHVWSSGHQPTGTIADTYHAHLATDRVTLRRRDGEIETVTEIAVVPEDAARIERITVTNNGGTVREVELTSYGEIVLAPRAADRVHPAFSNLFVETEWHNWCHAITATRRPRSADEKPLWMVHVLDTGRDRVGDVSFETDRARFIGRGRSTRAPAALEPGATLSGTTGAVLDPIVALRTRVRLPPGRSASVTFTTLVATSRERAFVLADRYHGAHAAQRALDLAWTSTQIELRELGISAAEAAACQDLVAYLLFPDSVLRAPRTTRARDDGWQQTLWTHGISGDMPVMLALIESTDGLPTLQSLLTAHRYWRLRDVTVDLIVVVNEPQGYLQELENRIVALILATGGSAVMNAAGGVHVRNRGTLGPADVDTITAVARLRIDCDGRSLARVVDTLGRTLDAPSDREAATAAAAVPAKASVDRTEASAAPVAREAVAREAVAREPLAFDNGIGGLTADGRYRIHLRGDAIPPAPWANVIANARGGFVVTERGAGFTWAGSSYFFRLSPWSNDPVSDPVGEALYLRDEATGEYWSPTPAPVRSDLPYVVEHGPGLTEFRHERTGIATTLSLGMAGDDPVKLAILRITNRSDRPRTLTLTSYVAWTLGTLREQTQHRVGTAFDPDRSAILAENPFEPQFAAWTAFSAMSGPVSSHTGDRRDFIGRNGTPEQPTALHRPELLGRTGLGVDPCAGLRRKIALVPGEARTVVILLGAAPSEAEALRLVDTYRDVAAAEAALAGSLAQWEERLGTVTVQTPEPAFDAIVNRWSLYQAWACRMFARSAVYQSSGAYGFRDQLQDAMAFVYANPSMARAHILRAAARQFPEGDVQHWWHPETGRGVRTRFSDDLAWLPFVVEHYVRVTGDSTVLDETVPFLTMRALQPEEHEAYDRPEVSAESASVYTHGVRALLKACTRGAHGLPLIGTGDWNDGMNRVGAAGRGESVWLAWFLIATLRSFARICDARGDGDVAADFRTRADGYAGAVESDGWDGAWYRRAFYDDGTPLGSAADRECRIDAIAQSWSVLAGGNDPARQARAMDALAEHLVDPAARLIRLLTPPFDETDRDPGYIKGYVPGVRENGAQYTHAALWAVQAAARRGEGDRAFDWFQMLNPFTHGDTAEKIATYRVEPYVVAADVYTAEGALGRGGWTWYTGSASWTYRVGLEDIVGFRKEGDALRIEPCVPESWPELRVKYRFGSAMYEIVVERPGLLRARGAAVTLDGQPRDDGAIPLSDDGARHTVRIAPKAAN
ncbi:MAG: glucoamylase family protein [Gemmatimonadaceae bacterium]